MKNLLLFSALLLSTTVFAQNAPIDFETGGHGASWTWTVFENVDNPPLNITANPDPTGLNTSATVAEFTARAGGAPWVGCESMHGADIGTYTLTSANSILKIMVWKTTISDVGIKLVESTGGGLPEVKVANTLTNQWEELTFDFSGQENIAFDQIVVFPDFTFDARTEERVIFFDNIIFEMQDPNNVNGCMDPAATNYNPLANTDDGSCLFTMTFNVDMNCELGTFSVVELTGPFFGWCAGCVVMSDTDGDNVYSVTVDVPGGGFEYKYSTDNFLGQENLIDDVQAGMGACAPITDGAGFANREINVVAAGSTSDTYGTCGVCDPNNIQGCTDMEALNYNPLANVDDGSCTYPSALDPIDFEPAGQGGNWTWTVFENDDNPPLNIVANPNASAPNASATVAEFTARVTGQQYAGCESMHGSDIGVFTLSQSTSLVKIMVWKSTISDVGIKMVQNNGGGLPEVKVANTLINQWEELTFDFTGQEGIEFDQIVIFPDFIARTQENVIYFDNITFNEQDPNTVFGCTDMTASNYDAAATSDNGSCLYAVTFIVDMNDVLDPFTTPEVNGTFNGWCGGCAPMADPDLDGIWEITIELASGDFEFKFAADSWMIEEALTDGSPCTFTTISGPDTFINRTLNVATSMTYGPVAWNACASCPEDIDGDGDVDINDFLAFNSSFGQNCTCPADINGDGSVDINDFLAFNSAFGQDCD